MKYTGWVLMAVGAMLGLYALFGSAPPDSGVPTPDDGKAGLLSPGASVIVLASVASFLGGMGMLLFGGRGVFKTRNPAVRN